MRLLWLSQHLITVRGLKPGTYHTYRDPCVYEGKWNTSLIQQYYFVLRVLLYVIRSVICTIQQYIPLKQANLGWFTWPRARLRRRCWANVRLNHKNTLKALKKEQKSTDCNVRNKSMKTRSRQIWNQTGPCQQHKIMISLFFCLKKTHRVAVAREEEACTIWNVSFHWMT